MAAQTKTKKEVANPNRKVTLPEELAGVEALDENARAKMVADFAARQTQIFEKRLANKVASFSEKLSAEGSVQREIIMRRILIQKLKGEVNERREAIKNLRAENKLIRQQARENVKANKEARKPSVIWKSDKKSDTKK